MKPLGKLSDTYDTNRGNKLYIYEDKGCDVSLSCLTCPLPVCKHDDPMAYRMYKNNLKDMQIITALIDMSVKDVAEHFDIDVRTVFRAMARTKAKA